MSTQLSPPRVTVAILAWNAWEYTARCLASLRTTLRDGDQVVVVDNGSSDLTGALLKRYPWVQVLTNTVNQGFAKGCNQAAARRLWRGHHLFEQRHHPLAGMDRRAPRALS